MTQPFAAVIERLDYDFSHFEINHFLRHVQRQRDKDLFVKAVKVEPELHGLWVPGPTADYVFYNVAAHAVHKVHILLHELAHILLNHRPPRLDELLPDLKDLSIELNFEMLREMGLMRTIKADLRRSGQEQEAEAFARELQYHIIRAGRGSYLSQPSSSIPALEAFTGSLSFED